MMQKQDVCSNPNCSEGRDLNGRRCSACRSYRSAYRMERPESLCKYPHNGHPLATTAEVCQLIGLTCRVVDYLIRTYRAHPTVIGRDSGKPHGWLPDDVVAMLAAYVESKVSDVDGKWPGVELTFDTEELKWWVVAHWPEGRPMEWPCHEGSDAAA